MTETIYLPNAIQVVVKSNNARSVVYYTRLSKSLSGADGSLSTSTTQKEQNIELIK